MANVHIRTVNDNDGQLVDVVYFHGFHAPPDALAWPAPDSVDHPVYCGGDLGYWPDLDGPGCGERVDAVPLTDWGRREYGEMDE